MGESVMHVRDAILNVADDLDNIRIPDGLTAAQARGLVFEIARASDNLRKCYFAMKEREAAMAAEEEKKIFDEEQEGAENAEAEAE